jgi:hypothetical protein
VVQGRRRMASRRARGSGRTVGYRVCGLSSKTGDPGAAREVSDEVTFTGRSNGSGAQHAGSAAAEIEV